MNFKKIVMILSGILLCSFNLYSEETPFNFLRYISNARAAALSGAVVSITNDPSVVFYNPASISTVQDKDFSVTFLKHVLDINSGNISYVRKLDDIGVVSANLVFTSNGSFDYADDKGNLSGSTFGANDLAFGFSYSNILDTNLYYGATLKFMFVSLEKYSTSAVAVDAGLLYRLKDNRTNVGLSILHAGTQLSKIGGVSENPPIDIRAGINHRLQGLPLLVNFSLHHLADETDKFVDKLKNFSLGGEFYIGKYIQLRAGYENMIRSVTASKQNKGLTGISAGLGIVTKNFNFDYAYTRYGEAAHLHRFSLALDLKQF